MPMQNTHLDYDANVPAWLRPPDASRITHPRPPFHYFSPAINYSSCARAQNPRQNATKTPKRAKTRHGKVRLSKYGKIRSRNGQVFHPLRSLRCAPLCHPRSSILHPRVFPVPGARPKSRKKCQIVPKSAIRSDRRWCGAPPTSSPSIRAQNLTIEKMPPHGQETVKFLAVAAEVTRLKLRPERRSCHASRITHHASPFPGARPESAKKSAKSCQKVPSGQPGRWGGAPPTPSPSTRLKTLTMKKTPLPRSRNGQVFHPLRYSAARRPAILDLQSSILTFSQFPRSRNGQVFGSSSRGNKAQTSARSPFLSRVSSIGVTHLPPSVPFVPFVLFVPVVTNRPACCRAGRSCG